MNAGKLRHRVTIEEGIVTLNDHGQEETVWQQFAPRLPACVVELSGRELWNAQQIKPDITLRVELRWLPGVTSKMRLKWHDCERERTLEIAAPPINPDGRKREMHLLCKEAW